jgi:hypothetical protein
VLLGECVDGCDSRASRRITIEQYLGRLVSKIVQTGQGLKVRKSGNNILLISTADDVGDALGPVVGVRPNVKSVVVDEEAGKVNTGKWVVK